MTSRNIQLADFRAAWRRNRERCLEAINRVGESGWLILGKEVEQFERDLAKAWGTEFAVGVASGLDALEIAFRCVGARPGDRFLTTPLSAFATTLAILRVGGVPVFCDVDASGLLDLQAAEDVLKRSGPVRFIVPVHLYGHAHRLAELQRFSKQQGAVVIEDCAQAIGARSDGKPVGSASPCCATSFYPTKNLGALGDGGALLTGSAEIAARARALRDYGQTAKYVHSVLGLNSRLDELQAALLRSVQLPDLAAATDRRRQLARRYLERLNNRRLTIPPVPAGSESVWHLFPVIVDGDRDRFQSHLKSKGVASGVHYPVLIPDQQAIKEAGLTIDTSTLERARTFARQEVSIPLHPLMSDEDCDWVISVCNDWS